MTAPAERTQCFFNLTTDERVDMFQQRRTLNINWVFKTFFGWVAIPFVSIALTLSIIYVIVVFNAIKQHRVSRKCYLLLLNRTVGDILACIAALIDTGYVLTVDNVNRDVVGVIETLFISSFWSAMVSYVSLSVLKLYAVARPFYYRQAFTMKRCVYLIVLSWVMFSLMAIYALTVSALVKIPALNQWSGCKIETCMRPMFKTRNALTVIVYFFTIVTFLGTVFYIRRARRFVDSFHRGGHPHEPPKRTRFPLWKLALNVGTFAFLYLFYVIWATFLVINPDKCFFQRHLPEMVRIFGLLRLTLLVRILIDPVISFVTDFQIRRGVFELFHINCRPLSTPSRKKIFRSSDSTTGTPADRKATVQTVA